MKSFYEKCDAKIVTLKQLWANEISTLSQDFLNGS